MPIKDCDRKARANYRKKVDRVVVELYPTDEDIKAKLASVPAKATYIKQLIREDIKRSN
jgi:hypothetical protein